MTLETSADRFTQMRCAIYTRKSTAHGLDQAVNSLETQREVCSAYIKCQAHRNWIELPKAYDDGGFSGGNMERPALKRLLGDIELGRVDMVVVYKIDRLSRSLGDFIRLVEVLDRYGARFVSVTQTFDTSDSMGRLVLNILLTFAQFERELAGDRVRDKKAALKRRGMFVGGTPPFGYMLKKGGKLVADPERADVVTELFDRFPIASASALARELRSRGITTRRYVTRRGAWRGGHPLYTNQVLNIISNPLYTGFIEHRGDWIKADIEPLTTRAQWDAAQEAKQIRVPGKRDVVRNFLLDILHDEHGRRMKMHGATGRSAGLRYYKSEHAVWARGGPERRVMVDADRIEKFTVSAVETFLVDRIALKEAVLSLGLYSDEVRRLLRKGGAAAKRLRQMDQAAFRSALSALVPRAEVNASELKLYVCCYELSRFLAWDGIGQFAQSVVRNRQAADRVHVVRAPGLLISGRTRFVFPIEARSGASLEPKPWLVDIINQAGQLRALTLANRDKTIEQLAREQRMSAARFARTLRVNYLAPDIQTAIIDGTEPDTLTVWDLLNGPMPLNWEQQRRMLGFE